MCEPFLTWNMVAMIAALVVIALIPVDLLIRFLNKNACGLIPYRAILSPFFLLDDVRFQDVDKEYQKKYQDPS